MTTIGFIGSGNIGSQLARLSVAQGYTVVMSNSRGPETLSDLVAELGDNATAATALDAAIAGDIVVVTVPLAAIETIAAAPLAGKIVIDTNNYYFERDGHIAELDDETITVSEILANHLPGATVVKAFNNIQADDLTTAGTAAGTDSRRALPMAGDDADAKKTVAALIDSFGFDVVDAGALAEGWRFQRDTPAYGVVADSAELKAKLAAATRKNAA
ncbi:MAG: oxidoreductase [Glaciihabitans sp.]|nr:oxidoreductase [Glaciihabitans sp.]